jgi:Cu/Ag efflux pump CusA
MGTDWSPVGQIFWYTLKSTNPKYDLMELKSIEDWTLEKQFKSVPNVVDASSFGGTTREYQVRIDPNSLVAHAIHRADGSVLDNDDVVEGIVLLRKGANADETLAAIHERSRN